MTPSEAPLLVVDNSTLGATARCSRKVLLASWHRLRGPGVNLPMEAGRAVHHALAGWMLDRDTERAMGVIEAEYRPLADQHCDPTQSRDRMTWTNVERVMRAWFEGDPTTAVFEVEATEDGFAVGLCEGVVFVGPLDGRGRSRTDGQPYVIEHKTTGNIDKRWREQFRSDAQLSGYLYAAGRATGTPWVGAFVNGIELSFAPDDPVRKCKTHGMAYAECGAVHPAHNIAIVTRGAQDIEAWRRDAVRLAGRYAELVRTYRRIEQVSEVPAEGTFNGECQWCEFREFCQQGARREHVEVMLTDSTWEPYEGVRPGQWQRREDVYAAATLTDAERGEE